RAGAPVGEERGDRRQIIVGSVLGQRGGNDTLELCLIERKPEHVLAAERRDGQRRDGAGRRASLGARARTRIRRRNGHWDSSDAMPLQCVVYGMWSPGTPGTAYR